MFRARHRCHRIIPPPAWNTHRGILVEARRVSPRGRLAARERGVHPTEVGTVLELVPHLELVAEECEFPLSELTVAWVLSHPAITGVSVGARRPEQVDRWIGAGIVELGAGIAGDLVRMAADLVNDPPETDEPDAGAV